MGRLCSFRQKPAKEPPSSSFFADTQATNARSAKSKRTTSSRIGFGIVSSLESRIATAAASVGAGG
jgi:hypothetical protein